MLARFLSTLSYCFRNFLGFAIANAYLAVLIASDDERREAETTAAFDDLGTTVDEDNFLEEFWLFGSSVKVLSVSVRCSLVIKI